MSNVRDAIALEYEGLPNGATAAGQLCPACQGGSTGEGTLSVTREDNYLKFYCHRASCGFRGATGTSWTYGSRIATPPTRGIVGRNYLRESEPLPADVREKLAELYSIGPTSVSRWELGWCEEEKRLVLPVFDLQGEAQGSVLRSLTGASPKVINHTEPMAMAWYANVSSRSCIIVEDQLSAIRASAYMNAVALLGTNLNEDRVYEIKAKKFRSVYLALDADAYSLSVRLATIHRGVLPLRLLSLSKDIKNQTEQELTELLAGLS